MQNKGTFIQPGGKDKDIGLTAKQYNPDFSIGYVRDMLSSQNGDIPSRQISEAEIEEILNSEWGNYYKNKRRR